MTRLLKYAIFAVVVSLSTYFCGATELTHIWKEDAYTGAPYSSVLVIGVTDEEAVRRSFENRFVRKLKGKGIEAFSSAAVISSEKRLKKEVIIAAIQELGADAVLVTHLVGVEEEDVRSPSTGFAVGDSYQGEYYQDYHAAYDHVHGPRYYTTHVKVRLETNLYDARTEKKIWTAQSQTVNPQSDAELFNAVIDAVIRNLRKNKLLS
ncbi:MAG: hypothetical protein JSU72_10925 [Deltaproteobacteria bacterium]|nr:MAG: hypothetical protein JSU72_10925 [Deltaproteobacteria bacterium]